MPVKAAQNPILRDINSISVIVERARFGSNERPGPYVIAARSTVASQGSDERASSGERDLTAPSTAADWMIAARRSDGLSSAILLRFARAPQTPIESVARHAWIGGCWQIRPSLMWRASSGRQ